VIAQGDSAILTAKPRFHRHVEKTPIYRFSSYSQAPKMGRYL